MFMTKPAPRQTGFTLLEVLIALLVISIGLLGIAGMQALAINNTSVARVQSLAALQAASLASAMQANEAYWQKTGATTNTSVNGAVLTDATLNSYTVNCSTTVCNLPVQMAAWDVKQWGQDLAALLPGGSGQIVCTNNAGTPITCSISVNWQEKNVALNAGPGAALPLQSYSMVVQP